MEFTFHFLGQELWYGGASQYGAWMPVDSECSRSICFLGNERFVEPCAPLFLSSEGRILYSDRPFDIFFDRGCVRVSGPGRIYLEDGFGCLKGAQQAAASRLFSLTGTTPPSVFMEAPQYNTWMEFSYHQNQRDILAYARSLVESGMEPGVFIIDEGWAPDYGDFDFCARKFSDPAKMVRSLHEMGFHVMLWMTPHISPDGDTFRQIRNKGYLLRDKNGEIAVRSWWNGYSCILDFSNPECCRWFRQKLDQIMEKYGVDGFKFDSGASYLFSGEDQTCVRQLPLEHTRSFDRFCSQYAYHELRLVYDCPGRPVVCRLQDKRSCWQGGLDLLIPGSLALGLIGYPYSCPDMIGGGDLGDFGKEDKYDEELYLRWLEASLLCPMLQFSMSPRRLLSPDSFETVRKLTERRRSYTQVILELAQNAARTGEPIMRYMEYQFPHQGLGRVTDQFMLGSRILVAPVTRRGASDRTVQLPEGLWADGRGDTFRGGCSVKLSAPVGSPVILEKVD